MFLTGSVPGLALIFVRLLREGQDAGLDPDVVGKGDPARLAKHQPAAPRPQSLCHVIS